MTALYYDNTYPAADHINQQLAVKDIDRLGMMVFFAAVFHAIFILGFGFDFLDNARLEAPPSLEVILVQKHNNTASEQADYLAQVSQEGGGESETRLRPSEAFAATEPTQQQGIAPQPFEQSLERVKQSQNEVITQLFADDKLVFDKKADFEKTTQDRTQQLEALALQIAKQTSELRLTTETYARLPKVLQVTARTREYAPAAYMSAWVDKVERLGNLNYPQDARLQQLQGSVLVEVEIHHTGRVIETNILRSSGSTILDEAVKRTIRLAAPFAPFTPALKEVADRVEIIRTWVFAQGDLVTN